MQLKNSRLPSKAIVVNSPDSVQAFYYDWYQEVQGFLLRAAFETGRLSADACHKCGSASGVYLQVCDDCMTRLNGLDE